MKHICLGYIEPKKFETMSESERNAIRVIAENTAGVTGVHDHLVYIEPYTGTVIDAPGDQTLPTVKNSERG